MTGFLTEPSRGEFDSGDIESAFRSVIELLRTSHDRENGFDSEDGNAKASSAGGSGKSPNTALHDRIISLECPSLSLRHLGHLNIGENSRVQAEQESAALLARPFTIEVNPQPTENGSIRIDDLPKALMNNMYESFAILVDSRLRVYSKIFLRHLTSLVSKRADAFGILQMGQKLETLHDIGGQITALSMQVHADLDGVEPEWEELEPPSGLMKKYEIDYKYQKDEKWDHQRHKEKMFGVVLGQCKEGTKDLVKGDRTFKSLEKGGDVVGLINLNQDLCYGTDKKRYPGWTQQAQLRRTVSYAAGRWKFAEILR